MKKKILLTGGAGFIGSHVAKKLSEEGFFVVIVDNLNNYYSPKLKRDRLNFFLDKNNCEFIKSDIANYTSLKKVFQKNKFEAICHLAAQPGVSYSLKNPWAYERSNLLGTLNLLELAKEYSVNKFVFASSSSVYGASSKLPFSEKDTTETPISLYAATKKSTELMAYTYHHLYGISMVGLRFFTVYGPWGRPDMAYFKFADLISQGQPIDLYNFGQMERDFTYIDDIVEGVLAAIKKDFKFEIFNLGNNQSEKIDKFVGLIEKYLGKKAQKNLLPIQPGDVPKTWADIGKAKSQLDFSPKTSIEEGLEKFVFWYKDYYKIK
jgi:UDP-glucuronate 4-epimerase